MLASDLISHDMFPLKKSDTVEAARLLMEDWKVYELPVVEAGKVVGHCLLNDLLAQPAKQKVVHAMQHNCFTVQSTQHLFEVLKLFSEHNLSVASVMRQEDFVGLISGRELLGAYKLSALSQPGGIIELQMPSRSYSLSELSRLIESNDAKILHLYVKSLGDENGHIEVSLKLNISDLKNVISTLERFNYQITGIFQAAPLDDNFSNRYSFLMKYLDT